MSRDLHADTLNSLSRSDLETFHLFTFEFSTPFRLTDHPHDIVYNFGLGNETFLSTGRLKNFSTVEETSDISNPSINISLTGANSADIALALTEKYSNRRVLVRKGFFNTTGATRNIDIVAKPFIVFDGRVDSWSIVDDPQGGESTVTWKISSHWADWEKIAGRKCNNEDANLYFPNEKGFSFTYDQIGDRIWGRVRKK